MPSSLFQNQNPQRQNPLQMIAEFKKFAKNMSPQKAEELVKQKLQSGEMSQAQFEQLKQQAQSFLSFLK
nr:MAG TPA: hypothetical protein [Caudoviricetes sp.]